MISSNSVRLIFFEQSIGCETCAPTRRVLEEIVAENPDIALEVLNLVLDKEKAAEYGVDRVPAVIIACARLRSHSLLRRAAGQRAADAAAGDQHGRDRRDEAVRREPGELKAVSTPVALQVFFTPTCVYCPQMISLANQAAIENPFDHRRRDRCDRVSRSRPALQRERRAENGHQ